VTYHDKDRLTRRVARRKMECRCGQGTSIEPVYGWTEGSDEDQEQPGSCQRHAVKKRPKVQR